ncbi:hypothetical protein PR048_004546, partial [Dryococelus australis]
MTGTRLAEKSVKLLQLNRYGMRTQYPIQVTKTHTIAEDQVHRRTVYSKTADLLWRSRLVSHLSRVREVLGSIPGKGTVKCAELLVQTSCGVDLGKRITHTFTYYDAAHLASRAGEQLSLCKLCFSFSALRHVRGRGGVKVRLLAFHQGEPSSISGGAAPGLTHAGIVPDDATDRRVFSGTSPFPRSSIPALLHTHLTSPSSALTRLRHVVFRSTPRAMKHYSVAGVKTRGKGAQQPLAGEFPPHAEEAFTRVPRYSGTSLQDGLTFQKQDARLSADQGLQTNLPEASRVRMEQRQNARAEETGYPGVNSPTSGSVRHDYHLRKFGVTRPRREASSLTAQPLRPLGKTLLLLTETASTNMDDPWHSSNSAISKACRQIPRNIVLLRVRHIVKAWLAIRRIPDGCEMVHRWSTAVLSTWTMLGPSVSTTSGVKSRSGGVVRLLASHHGESGSIPRGIAPMPLIERFSRESDILLGCGSTYDKADCAGVRAQIKVCFWCAEAGGGGTRWPESLTVAVSGAGGRTSRAPVHCLRRLVPASHAGSRRARFRTMSFNTATLHPPFQQAAFSHRLSCNQCSVDDKITCMIATRATFHFLVIMREDDPDKLGRYSENHPKVGSENRARDPPAETRLTTTPHGARGGVVVRLLASHQSGPGSILGRVTPGFFRMWASCRTMPLAGGFSRDLPYSDAVNSRLLARTGFEPDWLLQAAKRSLIDRLPLSDELPGADGRTAFCCGCHLKRQHSLKVDTVRMSASNDSASAVQLLLIHPLPLTAFRLGSPRGRCRNRNSSQHIAGACAAVVASPLYCRELCVHDAVASACRPARRNSLALAAVPVSKLGSPLVDDWAIMNAVKYRVVSGEAWTSRTIVISNTDTNRTGVNAVVDGTDLPQYSKSQQKREFCECIRRKRVCTGTATAQVRIKQGNHVILLLCVYLFCGHARNQKTCMMLHHEVLQTVALPFVNAHVSAVFQQRAFKPWGLCYGQPHHQTYPPSKMCEMMLYRDFTPRAKSSGTAIGYSSYMGALSRQSPDTDAQPQQKSPFLQIVRPLQQMETAGGAGAGREQPGPARPGPPCSSQMIEPSLLSGAQWRGGCRTARLRGPQGGKVTGSPPAQGGGGATSCAGTRSSDCRGWLDVSGTSLANHHPRTHITAAAPLSISRLNLPHSSTSALLHRYLQMRQYSVMPLPLRTTENHRGSRGKFTPLINTTLTGGRPVFSQRPVTFRELLEFTRPQKRVWEQARETSVEVTALHKENWGTFTDATRADSTPRVLLPLTHSDPVYTFVYITHVSDEALEVGVSVARIRRSLTLNAQLRSPHSSFS